MVEWSIIKSDLKATENMIAGTLRYVPRAVYNAIDWSGYFGRNKDAGDIAPDMPHPALLPLATEAILMGILFGSPYASLADASIRLYHMRYEAIKEAKKAKPSSE